MSGMKQGGNEDDDSPCCPPHPAFVHGLCSKCGAKEDTGGGAPGPGVAVEYWLMKDDDDDSPCCPPHPAFVNGLCSKCGAKEDDTAGGLLGDGVTVAYYKTNQGGDAAAAEHCPPHPGFVGGLCSRCGAMEEDTAGGALGVTVAYETMKQGVDAGASASSLAAVGALVTQALPMTNIPRAPDQATLLLTKKLILILDLDHTLLNSTRLNKFSPIEQEKGFTSNTMDDPSMGIFRLDRYSINMLTKLRPFARGFLAQANTMFEMYVYTLGGPDYARAVVQLLDPDGAYFGERVVSSQESSRRDMKSLDVIPGAEDAAATVVIIDDTETVWPWHQDNLILIDRYFYFASGCNKLDYQFNSLAEQGLDEKEHDGALAVVLSVLGRVHKGFFDSVHDHGGHRADVRAVIREARSQVLRGCTLVFSLSESAEDNGEDSPMRPLAEKLGAVCQVDVDQTVTHVVAEDPRTQKAQWARSNVKFLVNPEWIKVASSRWCRQDELKGFGWHCNGEKMELPFGPDSHLLAMRVGTVNVQRAD
ncbi:hypothetical protein U9M48_021631 [Paspalum notatum var. saurae]|uniref:RNA polymerase II C-terminal domain phosphatase-like n=1 Tax=Paspalum notatum var. saurae TaxID=547442 RepID=A0AAQ3TL17_PASNO